MARAVTPLSILGCLIWVTWDIFMHMHAVTGDGWRVGPRLRLSARTEAQPLSVAWTLRSMMLQGSQTCYMLASLSKASVIANLQCVFPPNFRWLGFTGSLINLLGCKERDHSFHLQMDISVSKNLQPYFLNFQTNLCTFQSMPPHPTRHPEAPAHGPPCLALINPPQDQRFQS